MASLVAVRLQSPCNCNPWNLSSLRRALPPLRSRPLSFSRVSARLGLSSSRQCLAAPFSAPQSHMDMASSHLILTKEITTFGQAVRRTFRGIKIYAMRHGKRIARLNRPADQRKALVRGLTTELLRHGRIKTTLPRAKAIRRYVDKMITLAKDGSLHKRRQALAFVYDKLVVHCMFQQAPKRYADRNGGYTRIMKTFNRRGDNAPMAYIELVDWYFFYTLLF